jgi:hypothetical protein
MYKFIGGGIIICELYFDKNTGYRYPAIILGKEMYGKEKNKYADFGGGFDKKIDNNIYNTILREVLEEAYIHLGNINYIKELPQINIPLEYKNSIGVGDLSVSLNGAKLRPFKKIFTKKYYKIVIKRIDELDNNKFQQIRKKYISSINKKYSPWIEIGEIRHFYIHDIYYALINNLSKVKDSNGKYCFFRKRLWNILKNTNLLQFIINNINIL